jgi:hypothetical protein
MHVHLAATQLDLVARWQLLAAGWTERQVDDRAWRHGWRAIHDGVYALCRAPLRQDQRWLAACLTAPGTVLAGASAAACWGFLDRDPAITHVVRHGDGGPRRHGGVLVRHSTRLAAEIDWCGVIPITSPERTLIDLAPHLDRRALARATREAIRLKRLTARSLVDAVSRHRGWRGTKQLSALAKRYSA